MALFNGTSSRAATTGLGGVSSTADVNRTYAAIVNRTSGSAWTNIVSIASAANATIIGMTVSSGDVLTMELAAGTSNGPAVTTGWHYFGCDKPSGANVARFHKKKYGTDASVAHQAGAGVVTPSGTPAKIQLGAFDGTSDWFPGDMQVVAVWDRVLADWEHEWLADSLLAWQMLAPNWLVIMDDRTLPTNIQDSSAGGAAPLTTLTNLAVTTSSMPVSYGFPILKATRNTSTGQSIAVGQVVETETAQTITPKKSIAVAQVIETETAGTITPLKGRAIAVGQVVETETAGVVTPQKRVTLGQVSETETAQAITAKKSITVGQTVETETAQAIATRKSRSLTQAVETETAGAITATRARAVGQVTETETAQTITPKKSVAVGQVVETEIAQLITTGHGTTVNVGQVTETELAQTITPRKTIAIGQVVDTEIAQPITVRKTRSVGQVTETELPQTITAKKSIAVGQIIEAEIAQPMTVKKLVALTQAVETETAQNIRATTIVAVGQAVELEVAQAMSVRKLITLGQVVEFETAQPMNVPPSSALPFPSGRYNLRLTQSGLMMRPGGYGMNLRLLNGAHRIIVDALAPV